jgi:hypothetical protein
LYSPSNLAYWLRDFKTRYADQYGIISLGVFGSVARGEIRDNSDVDICVTTRTPDPFVLVHIKDDIERRLQRHVDIVRVREKSSGSVRK